MKTLFEEAAEINKELLSSKELQTNYKTPTPEKMKAVKLFVEEYRRKNPNSSTKKLMSAIQKKFFIKFVI